MNATPQMTVSTLAAALAGATYRNVVSSELFRQAKAAGLVIVYGMSDDLMEFDGAINDELGAYEGTTAYLTSAGLLQNECDSDENCPHFKKMQESASTIEALWSAEEGYSWTFRTAIPHETFEITEDGDPYCRGIVFALADVGKEAPTAPAALPSSEPEYCWSRDNETFTDDWDDIVGDHHDSDLAVGDIIWRGEVERIAASDLVSVHTVENFLDSMGEQAYDEVGEVAGSYPQDTLATGPDSPRTELLAMLRAWADKHATPTFWKAVKVKPYTVTADDLALREQENG